MQDRIRSFKRDHPQLYKKNNVDDDKMSDNYQYYNEHKKNDRHLPYELRKRK